MTAKLLFYVLALGISTARAEQVCDSHIYPLSVHAEQYQDNGDGTVTDSRSRLTWMRCSLGQSWSGSTCTGTADVSSWQSAQDNAARLNQAGGYAGRHDWRVPQIPELAMIVERQCTNPRTNLTLFPATPAGIFWTATTPADPGNAYVLSFGAEGAKYKGRGEAFHVRLVSGGNQKP